MKIQEFAQLTGLSTKTIRYYESIAFCLLHSARQTGIASMANSTWHVLDL